MSKKDPLSAINILTNKIRANEADYNLNRQTAKISALASGNLGKYKYLTGEDLNYRSNPVEKVFKEGLTDEEKKKSTGVFKKLDDIHRTNQEILRRTGNNNNNNDDDNDDDDDDDDDDDNKKKVF